MSSGRKDQRLKFLTPLAGRTFTLVPWKPPNPEWTHDHCRGCRVHICDSQDEDFHEAWVTTDQSGDEDWVCPKCFDFYRLVLNFKVRP
jgi:hypothetical protein